jgi:NADH-quinone oxidoreductase subunit M
VILGTFARNPAFGAIAAIGVVLAAIYLLWAYQRMAHGPVPAKHAKHPDLSARESALLAPVLALILLIGVYPKPLLDRIDPTSSRIVKAVDTGHSVDAAGSANLAAAEEP